jgi:adenylylsulfate kinase
LRLRTSSNFIESQPVVQNLRENTAFRELRGYQGFPEYFRQHHLTAGPLASLKRIYITPYVFSNDSGGSLVSFFYLIKDVSGYPAIVHGGLLAAMLDEGLGWYCFPGLPDNVGATVTLTVEHVSPMQTGSYGVLRAQTVSVLARKAWVEGHIETLAQNKESVIVAKARALFMSPKETSLLD